VPTLSEAIRRLVEMGLEASSKGEKKPKGRSRRRRQNIPLGNPHRSPIQAVTIAKIQSANTVVSTMTPMISSPHGIKSRAIVTNANMGINASLEGQGITFQQCQVEQFQY
jgi:hypothetical protein